MFGNEILNGKQLTDELNISQGQLYKLIDAGLPFHQFEHSRKYYVLEEVKTWLVTAGFKQKTTWKV